MLIDQGEPVTRSKLALIVQWIALIPIAAITSAMAFRYTPLIANFPPFFLIPYSTVAILIMASIFVAPRRHWTFLVVILGLLSAFALLNPIPNGIGGQERFELLRYRMLWLAKNSIWLLIATPLMALFIKRLSFSDLKIPPIFKTARLQITRKMSAPVFRWDLIFRIVLSFQLTATAMFGAFYTGTIPGEAAKITTDTSLKRINSAGLEYPYGIAAQAPDGKSIFCAPYRSEGGNKHLTILNRNQKAVSRFPVKWPGSAIVGDPKRNVLYLGSQEELIVFSGSEPYRIQKTIRHPGLLDTLKLSPNGDLLGIRLDDMRELLVLDLNTDRWIARTPIGQDFAFLSDREIVFIRKSGFVVYDLDTGKEVRVFSVFDQNPDYIEADGEQRKIWLISSLSGSLLEIDADSGRTIRQKKLRPGVRYPFFDPTNRIFLLPNHLTGEIEILDTVTLQTKASHFIGIRSRRSQIDSEHRKILFSSSSGYYELSLPSQEKMVK